MRALTHVALTVAMCLGATALAQPSATQPSTQAAAVGRRPGDTITNSIGMKLAYIPPGQFVMGSPADEPGHSANEPQHPVTLTKGFYIASTLVTQAQWRAVMGTNPSHHQGESLPVETVSWDDAVDFCRRLSQKEGKRYRLPTEAEWEYACRAGSTGAYGGTGSLGDMGWYEANSQKSTHPVRQKHANAWGLYDMHGDVWQWCSDWAGDYPAGAATDPTGPARGVVRVLRGGSWLCRPAECRSAYRNSNAPERRYAGVGVRVVLDAE